MSLDSIRQIPISEIIGRYVTLVKKGTTWQAACPFHDEKTPSFVVFPRTNSYKCFGCGAGGDGLKFVMEIDKLDFLEAAKRLAKDHGIDFEPKAITPEDQQRAEERRAIIAVHNLAAHFYRDQLTAHPAAMAYAQSRIDDAMLEEYMVGFAPPGWTKLYDHLRSQGYKEEFLIKTNLVRQSDKAKVFDAFQNRLVFPIISHTGDVVGFGGRAIEKGMNPKYINSGDSDWYNKSQILYGLRNATDSIKEKGYVNLVEGYTDVTTLAAAGHPNTVALCGTALTTQHADLIKRFTTSVNFLLDADAAGIRAVRRSAEILLKAGFSLTITTTIPRGQDPDQYFRESADPHYNRVDFFIHLGNTLFEGAEADPVARSNNIREYAVWLGMVPEYQRLSYIELVTTMYRKQGVTKKILQAALDTFATTSNGHDKVIDIDEKKLPKYVDRDEYQKYGFYESKPNKGDMYAPNQYIFEKDGRISNFVMEPLYHIKGTNDPKKLFKIVNKYGESAVIEMDMDAMNSLPRFRKIIEGAGNNLFEGKDTHLLHLKRKWYDKTLYCKRIENLGWQPEGFWAWANGITTPNEEFIPVDENGIVSYANEHYFIPALSIIYSDQTSIFKSERRFIYVKGSISFHEWARHFIGIYGEQSKVSIAFYLTSLFSDYIFDRLDNLPILNFYGKKGTGKNAQAMSLMALFGKMQNPLQIHNATKAGLATHMEEFVNALFWIDEYKNSLDIDMIESLKGIYNRMGRTRNSMKEGQKKEGTTVNSMGIITGQEMPTVDIALFSRLIFLPYFKDKFTQEENDRLAELQKIQRPGLSHITARLLRHRGLVEENYMYAFNEVQDDLADNLTTAEIDGRILRNYCSVLTTFKTLEKVLDLPFDYKDLLKVAVDRILSQHRQVATNDELSQFWSTIETGVERGDLIEGKNFKIKWVDYMKIRVRNEETIKEFKPSKQIIFLKWAGIYAHYAEITRRSNMKPLPESTLVHYLETSPYFQGKVGSVRFENEVNQARAFDYAELHMNLTRSDSANLPGAYADDDDTGPDSAGPAPTVPAKQEEMPF